MSASQSTPLADAPAQPQRPTTPPAAQRSRTRRPRRGAMIGAGFRNAFQAIWANRMRSLLTILGIVVGVAAVISVVTLTQGTSQLLNSRITGLGSNVLTITPAAGVSGGAVSCSRESLTPADATAIAGVAHVINASPVLTVSGQVIAGGQNWNTRVQGVNVSFQAIGTWEVSEGSWFSASDDSAGTPVAVVGQTVVDNLFTPAGIDPVGQTILVSGQGFRVVGVLKSKGSSGFGNQDDIVYVPFAAARGRLNNSQFVSQIQAQADSADNVNGVLASIQSLLRDRHHLAADGSADDFQARSSTQIVQTAQQFSQTLTILLVGVAAISLLVGGIGIMNIMLVSVTERTREIGIRMAIGARRADIRNQFLIEALTLSSTGGVIGIIIGLVGGLILTTSFGLPFALSVISIALAFGVAAAVGVVFGFYPAVRASQLDPIVALRAE